MPSNIQTTYDNEEDQENNNPMLLLPTSNWKHSAAKAKFNLDKILSDIGELNINGLDKFTDLQSMPLSPLSKGGNNQKNQRLDTASIVSGPTKKKKDTHHVSPNTKLANKKPLSSPSQVVPNKEEDEDELQQIPTVELLEQTDHILRCKGEREDDEIVVYVDDNYDNQEKDTTTLIDTKEAATAAAALMKQRIELENRRKEEEERTRILEQQRLDEEERRQNEEEDERTRIEQQRLDEEKKTAAEAELMKRKARAEEQQRLDKEKAALELEKRRKLEVAKLNEQEEEKKKQDNEQTERQAVQDLVHTILQLNTKQVVKEGKSAYYTILGVKRDASLGNIKKGYRKRALKLHPDKDKFSTPNAEEAFRVVSQAYNVLSDPESRRKYDDYQQQQRRSGGSSNSRRSKDVKSNTTSTTTSETTKKKVPSQYNIIPSGTRVTIASTHVTTINGLQGCILEYAHNTSLYTVQMDGTCSTVVSAPSTSIFQNVIVCLRANKAPELACAGVFLVTLSSYYKDNCGGCYQARYSVDGGGGRTKEAYLRAEQFIIPNGTVVRVGHEYGLIVDWREESTGYTQVDSSYYEVQMSETEVLRVKMGNVRL